METVVVIAHVSLFFLTRRAIRHTAFRMGATGTFNKNAHTHAGRTLLFKQVAQVFCSTFGNGNKLFGHEMSLKLGLLTILVNYSQDAMARADLGGCVPAHRQLYCGKLLGNARTCSAIACAVSRGASRGGIWPIPGKTRSEEHTS